MMIQLIEAALRAVLVALTVWAGLRVFRVRNVLAQKAAWGLVLACAVAMPLVMRWQMLPASLAVRVPVTQWCAALKSLPIREALLMSTHAELSPAPQARLVPVQQADASVASRPATLTSFKYKPHAGKPVLPATEQLEAAGHFEASTADAAAIQVQPAVNQHAAKPFTSKISNWAAEHGRLYATRLGWILYLAVCGVLLSRMVYGIDQAWKLWQSAEVFVPYPEDDPGFGLRMRFSRAVSSPVTIGSGVLLPYECLEWDAEKLRMVLAHERAHVRQGDFYLQLLAGIYSAVFWFSPLGWWLKNKLSDLGEVISDHAGLDEAASSASYAQVLLEFAAMPRPNQMSLNRIGVAMANSRNLSQRIERLLNESSFRQAFADGRKRMFVAVLLVPVALFVGTALIRVEAATQVAPPAPPQVPALAVAPTPAVAPVAAPAPQPAPDAVQDPIESADISDPAIPPPPAAPDALAPPAPKAPGTLVLTQDGHMVILAKGQGLLYSKADSNRMQIQADAAANTMSLGQDDARSESRTSGTGHGYSYSYSDNGDSWALVTDPSERVTFSGDWHDSTRDSINKVRKLTSGKFLWFKRGDKTYFIDDQAMIGQIEAMYKPIEDLGRKQEELGKKQEELGKQQEEFGEKQETASVPAPDISKEMAKLNEAVARLNAKNGTSVSQEELSKIQERLSELQERLGDLDGKIGERQGQLGEMQGKLGEQQGKLGEEQGHLGELQGKLSEEADRKIKSMIDQSLHNGKAKPVE
jgi:hypothetical protein